VRVVALVPDLLFGSRIQAALAAAGHDVRLVGDQGAALAASADADLLLVDLTAEGLDVAALGAAAPPVLGAFAHVHPEVRDRALAAGFDMVVPRSRIAREAAALVAGFHD
jgi:DNA-binding response OmpR family regulator